MNDIRNKGGVDRPSDSGFSRANSTANLTSDHHQHQTTDDPTAAAATAAEKRKRLHSRRRRRAHSAYYRNLITLSPSHTGTSGTDQTDSALSRILYLDERRNGQNFAQLSGDAVDGSRRTRRPFVRSASSGGRGRKHISAQLELSRRFWDSVSGRLSAIELSSNVDGRAEVRQSSGTQLSGYYGRGPNSDILLQSDWPAIERNMQGIRANLRDFVDFRANLPSDEYFQLYPPRTLSRPATSTSTTSRAYGYGQALNNKEPVNSGSFTPLHSKQRPSPVVGVPSMAEIRCRLAQMEFHIERRVRELLQTDRSSASRLAPQHPNTGGEYPQYSERVVDRSGLSEWNGASRTTAAAAQQQLGRREWGANPNEMASGAAEGIQGDRVNLTSAAHATMNSGNVGVEEREEPVSQRIQFRPPESNNPLPTSHAQQRGNYLPREEDSFRSQSFVGSSELPTSGIGMGTGESNTLLAHEKIQRAAEVVGQSQKAKQSEGVGNHDGDEGSSYKEMLELLTRKTPKALYEISSSSSSTSSSPPPPPPTSSAPTMATTTHYTTGAISTNISQATTTAANKLKEEVGEFNTHLSLASSLPSAQNFKAQPETGKKPSGSTSKGRALDFSDSSEDSFFK